MAEAGVESIEGLIEVSVVAKGLHQHISAALKTIQGPRTRLLLPKVLL